MFYIHSNEGRIFSGSLEQLPGLKRLSSTPSLFTGGSTEEKFELPSSVPQAVPYDDEPVGVSIKALEQYGEFLKERESTEPVYHAYQIMSKPVVSIQSTDSLGEINQQFIDQAYQLMPVLDENLQLIATLSKSIFYSGLIQSGKKVSENIQLFQFFDFSQQQVITANPVTDVRRIAKVLTDNRLDAMPVTEEDERLVGIVSRTDILRCLSKNPPLSLWC
jgi:acetoin utilization protein AcuB